MLNHKYKAAIRAAQLIKTLSKLQYGAISNLQKLQVIDKGKMFVKTVL